jgi:hypothetical protein
VTADSAASPTDTNADHSTTTACGADSSVASRTGAPGNDGRGIWLGDFEHDEADDILSVQSDEDDDDGGDAQNAQSGAKRRTAADLLDAQRYADSDVDSDEDSEDDGEAEEAERKGREIDKGFFAALDLGDGAGDEDEEQESDA